MSANTETFNPELPKDELPSDWTIEHTSHSAVYRLESPDVEHVVLQRWTEDTFAVVPMKPATWGNATAENESEYTETFSSVDDAAEYAIEQAHRLNSCANRND